MQNLFEHRKRLLLVLCIGLVFIVVVGVGLASRNQKPTTTVAVQPSPSTILPEVNAKPKLTFPTISPDDLLAVKLPPLPKQYTWKEITTKDEQMDFAPIYVDSTTDSKMIQIPATGREYVAPWNDTPNFSFEEYYAKEATPPTKWISEKAYPQDGLVIHSNGADGATGSILSFLRIDNDIIRTVVVGDFKDKQETHIFISDPIKYDAPTIKALMEASN